MFCVHTCSESDNALLIYGCLKFSKMAACRHLEFDPTGYGAVRSAVPENPILGVKNCDARVSHQLDFWALAPRLKGREGRAWKEAEGRKVRRENVREKKGRGGI